MQKNAQIGVFDSGVGGISVMKALRKELPNESFIYLADSANAPYGQLDNGHILDLSIKNAEFLLDKKVKLIVVACNTATGIAIKTLRKMFDVPFIGMEPAIKPASIQSVAKKIGVLATARTFEADHFNETAGMHSGDIELFVRVGDGLVELVEEGRSESPESEELLKSYLEPMIDAGIDQLVLGCTHYPFLMPLILKIIPGGIVVHDPAPAVARQTRRILEQMDGLTDMSDRLPDQFFSTGDRSVLDKILEQMGWTL